MAGYILMIPFITKKDLLKHKNISSTMAGFGIDENNLGKYKLICVIGIIVIVGAIAFGQAA